MSYRFAVVGSLGGASQAWASAGSQRSQHQARMFAKVDTDGGGGVDAAELDKLLSDVSQKTGVSLGDSAEILKTMDSNGDGSLSSNELGQGMRDLMPPPSAASFAQSRGAGGLCRPAPGGPNRARPAAAPTAKWISTAMAWSPTWSVWRPTSSIRQHAERHRLTRAGRRRENGREWSPR